MKQIPHDFLDKIVSIIPYSNGGFRRRMSAGVIALLGAVYRLLHDVQLEETVLFGSILSATVVGIILLLLIYSGGRLVEFVSESLVFRIAGNAAWSFFSLTLDTANLDWIRKLLIVSLGVPWRALQCLIKALLGESVFQWNPVDGSGLTQKTFDTLPDVVKRGLERPFEAYQEIAYRFLADRGMNDDVRRLVRQLDGRNRDVLVIVTASLIALFFALLPELGNASWELIGVLLLGILDNALTGVLFLVTIVCLLAFIALHVTVWSSWGYFLMLKHSLLVAVEYNTLISEIGLSDENAESNTTVERG